MKEGSAELRQIKKNNLKYIFPLILFIAIYPAFIIYNVHVLFQFAFIIGLVFFSYSYDRLEKELNSSRMKNFYVKSKINLKINELNKSIDHENRKYSINILESLIDDFN